MPVGGEVGVSKHPKHDSYTRVSVTPSAFERDDKWQASKESLDGIGKRLGE